MAKFSIKELVASIVANVKKNAGEKELVYNAYINALEMPEAKAEFIGMNDLEVKAYSKYPIIGVLEKFNEKEYVIGVVKNHTEFSQVKVKFPETSFAYKLDKFIAECKPSLMAQLYSFATIIEVEKSYGVNIVNNIIELVKEFDNQL